MRPSAATRRPCSKRGSARTGRSSQAAATTRRCGSGAPRTAGRADADRGSQHVYAIGFSPDGRFVASGSREQTTFGEAIKTIFGSRLAKKVGKTLRIWRVADGALLQTMSDQPDDVHSVRFSLDGRWLASSGEDPRVFVEGGRRGRVRAGALIQGTRDVTVRTMRGSGTFEDAPSP